MMLDKSLFVFCLLAISSQVNSSKISLSPSSLDIIKGSSKNITVSLSDAEIGTIITVEFLYNDEEKPARDYIDRLPNVVLNASESGEDKKELVVVGHYQGHVVLTMKPIQGNVSLNKDFILIDIALNSLLDIFIQIVGWIYFVAWSISFYPQIYLNFKRRSVVGLNFDFLALNILGHSCYSVFNLFLYTSTDVQQQYYEKHPHGVLPVLLNDVIFSCHAVFACIVTVVQCLIFHRGQQRVSHVARAIGITLVVFLLISTIVSVTHHLSTLSLMYFFSYVKLAITVIKYVPQAWMNYKRKSTEGWSIGNILLDFTGGILSVLQMFFLSINYNDWSSIFGSPTKFGLGLFSVLFDILFIVQHYVLYRKNDRFLSANTETRIVDEKSPMIEAKV